MSFGDLTARRSMFREVARHIVKTDRESRKYGVTVDTAGAIARALEQAFKAGAKAGVAALEPRGSSNSRARQPQEWLELPPRPRAALWTICLWSLGSDTPPTSELPVSIRRQSNRWAINVETGPGHDPLTTDYGDRTIRPLVKLDLLEVTDEQGRSLRLTDLARRIWQRAVAKNPMLLP